MKAVVMAGGEGTRLRPLTSNQPKPMVPIVGKPCMEHIVELLRRHGMEDVIVTVAFLPQAIRSYFGDGESLGVNIEYSVEESPLGTAGSVRLASGKLDDTFVVISGDALTDVNLQKIVDFHREKGAAVTIGLKSVENPLEFGIVVTDDEGRIERFLEKPSWGQVFSDTINTGIYVLEPEVLRHVPSDRPYDFSKELFPLLLEMGRPLYGYVFDEYWQDIGNLDQFRQANFDALDEAVALDVPGIRLRGNVWLGEGVELDDLEQIEGPAFVGNYTRIAAGATVAPYSVLGTGVTVREQARTSRSIVDSSTYVRRSAVIEGAILGRGCDVGSHVLVQEGAAIGTALGRGDRVVCSREAPPGCRMIKRAMIAGLNSTGVDVADLRVLPAAVNRHLLKTESFDAGFHVGVNYTDPEVVEIRFFEQPGIQLTASMQKEIEKHFTRLELRRAAHNAIGDVTYPARVRETYAQDLVGTLDADAIRKRNFRIVVDYGYSAASYVLPLVLGPLGVEAISAHAFVADTAEAGSATLAESIGQAKRLVPAVAADFGAVFDRSAERLFVIDERGREIAVEQTLLLFLRLLGSNGRRGKLAFPVTVTSEVDRLAEASGLEVVRTPANLSATGSST